MKKELSIKQIFDDFVSKTILTDNETEILKMYVKNESIIKIANDTSQSTATVSRVIADLKDKYNNYRKLEISKLNIFNKTKR